MAPPGGPAPRRPARRGPSNGPDRGFHRAEPRPRERAGGPSRRAGAGTVSSSPPRSASGGTSWTRRARSRGSRRGRILRGPPPSPARWDATSASARARGRAHGRDVQLADDAERSRRAHRRVRQDPLNVDEKWAVESRAGFAQTSLSLKGCERRRRGRRRRGGDDDGRGDDARSNDAKRSNDESDDASPRRVAVA